MNNTSRWWDVYIVRYALGTVVGAMCVYFILHTLGSEAKALWLMQPNITELNIWDLATICSENPSACLVQAQITQDLYSFNIVQLILLGIYGLAFTYFASGPVLVLHAVRRQIIAKKMTASRNKKCDNCLLYALVHYNGIGISYYNLRFLLRKYPSLVKFTSIIFGDCLFTDTVCAIALSNKAESRFVEILYRPEKIEKQRMHRFQQLQTPARTRQRLFIGTA